MDKLFESKFMMGLRNFGEKLAGNDIFSAISKSMISTMNLILVGAIFQIIASLPTLFGLWTTESQIYKMLVMPLNMTTGIISVFVVFMLGFNYSKSLNMKPMQNGIVALVCFLIVVAPIKQVALADGTTLNVLDSMYLGAFGLFVAILIGILSVRLSYLCERKNVVIKLPDSLPPHLSESFNALIPLIVNLVLWYGVALALELLTNGQMTLPLLINYLFSIPLTAVDSVPGMLFVGLFVMLLWVFGIHGSMVSMIALMPLMIQGPTINAELIAAGQDPIFYPVLLLGALTCAGGTGNLLPLILMGLKLAKSEQIKAISKAAIIPSLFNISEPVVFGFPIMYNPIMAIPFIVGPLISMVLIWIGFAVGFFVPNFVVLLTLFPIGVGEFLRSMAWQNVLIPVIAFVVCAAVYYPFFRVYDQELFEKENASKMEANPAA